MNGDNDAAVAEAGRDGLRAVRPASGRSNKQTGQPSVATLVPAVPEKLVRRWEAAYRKYGLALEQSSRMREADPVTVWEMATTSGAVAEVWRELAAAQALPWWILAAIESAAEAFEDQARDWEAREDEAEDAT